MSKRLLIKKHLESLDDIHSVMAAMKNIAVTETHKLAHMVAYQSRVQASVAAACNDFLAHFPRFGSSELHSAKRLLVVIGSQRGFCGDFNEALLAAVRREWEAQDATATVLIGRRLASKVGSDPRVVATLDGPNVVEEIQTVLLHLMDVLSGIQTNQKSDEWLDIHLLLNQEDSHQVVLKSVYPTGSTQVDQAPSGYPPYLHGSPATFYKDLLHHYLSTQLNDAFYGSLMTENRRRLQHMDSAMQRIEERRTELERRLNLLRQEEITEEIEVIMLSSATQIKQRR